MGETIPKYRELKDNCPFFDDDNNACKFDDGNTKNGNPRCHGTLTKCPFMVYKLPGVGY